MVETLEAVQRREDRRPGRLLVGGVRGPVRVQAGPQVLHHGPDRVRVRHQDLVDVGGGVGRAELASQPPVGAQHRQVAPAQAGDHDQLVEGVDVEVAAPGGQDRLGDARAVAVGIEVGGADPDVVQRGGQPGPVDQRVRELVDDGEPQALQDRHEGGQLERRAPLGRQQADRGGRAVPCVVRVAGPSGPQRDEELVVAVHRTAEQQDVPDRIHGVGGVAVAPGEPGHHRALQPAGISTLGPAGQLAQDRLLPRARQLRDGA